jgi:hypothetical protein
MANIAGGFVVVAHTMLAIELGMSMMTSPWAGGPGGTAGAGRVGAAGLEAVGSAVGVTVVVAVAVKKDVWKCIEFNILLRPIYFTQNYLVCEVCTADSFGEGSYTCFFNIQWTWK